MKLFTTISALLFLCLVISCSKLKTKIIGGIEFIKIPAGSFLMGSPGGTGYEIERPRHKVSIDSFYIGKYEVTQLQYWNLTGENPSTFIHKNNPVENVTWHDAMEFCRKFSEKFGVNARLPYEAEWEYAARAGSSTEYYWGNEWKKNYSWDISVSGKKTHSVGKKNPNSWGLFDTSGNVLEWCMDWFNAGYYKRKILNNPGGPGPAESRGNSRVLRGGSWKHDELYMRSSRRFWQDPKVAERGLIGFRIAVSLKPGKPLSEPEKWWNGKWTFKQKNRKGNAVYIFLKRYGAGYLFPLNKDNGITGFSGNNICLYNSQKSLFESEDILGYRFYIKFIDKNSADYWEESFSKIGINGRGNNNKALLKLIRIKQ